MKKSDFNRYDWLGLLLLSAMLYLFSAMPFISKASDVGSVFAILMAWAISYERGYKLVWKRDGDKKIAFFVFFIPSMLGVISFISMIVRWLS